MPADAVLQPGASVRVWSGAENESRHAPPADIFWTKRFVWNNHGDCAILVNASGEQVSLVRIGMRKLPRKGTKADLERRLGLAERREAALQRALEEAEARAARAAEAGATIEQRWSSELASTKAVRDTLWAQKAPARGRREPCSGWLCLRCSRVATWCVRGHDRRTRRASV